MNKAARATALRALAKLTQIDLVTAVKSKRHNPILDSEIHIEEELINLQESVDSLHTAGDALRDYPKMYSHISREKRAILKHCIGLIARMVYGKELPRPYDKEDVDYAIRKLIRVVMLEAQRTGRKIDDATLAKFRPFLSVRQRVQMRDFSMDLVVQASQFRRASTLANRLQQMSFRSR
jgi:hypothetical protein